MKDKITIRNKILLAKSYEDSIALYSNTFVGIGRAQEWNLEDTLISEPSETTLDINEVYRNLVAIKKITSADINLVIPRVDWTINTVYSEYTENLDLYSYESKEELPGVISANVGSVEIIGTNTAFESTVSSGDIISIPGDGVNSLPIKKEIISISSQTALNVNSAFSSAYTNNSYFRITNTYPKYSNNFYVRNNSDQVFKCLFNNANSISTIVPQITIGGQLPENPFIETADGYKWKYMYTIPSGLKEKFFTKDWIPVVSNSLVESTSRNGRLDIVKIINGGGGYSSNGNSASANIVTVIGDGTDAIITAIVDNGSIIDLNIINGGSNYTEAKLIVSDPSKTLGTAEAELIAVIGPSGGHGSDVAFELGASSVMISVDLDGSENDFIPADEVNGDYFDYRQLVLLRNPIDVENNLASNPKYIIAKILETESTQFNFQLDEIVYQGTSLEESTFSGRVVNSDLRSGKNKLWLVDTKGALDGSSLNGTIQSLPATPTGLIDSEIKLYSGEILYIENRPSISRNVFQTEQIKITVSF
jgi:hypothetical protein